MLDVILSRLEQVRQNGEGQWLACCPAHEDNNPSLSVRVCSDGAVMPKCFVGCSTSAIVDALGLTMRDLFAGDTSHRTHTSYKTYTPARKPKPVQRVKVDVDRGRIVRKLVYDYCDGMAEPYVKIVRREYSGIGANGKPLKDFRQFHWERERGEYVTGTRGFAFVPFDAPSVKEASTIYWCEGEKKCEALAAAIAGRKPEIVCSTRWGGSGSPLQAELVPWFYGKHTVIFADGEWVALAVLADGNNFSTWVNGVQVTSWSDDRAADANPRRGSRTEPGTIQLQGHDPTTDVLFRNIRLTGL